MISKWRNLGNCYRVRACCLKRKLYNTMLNYKSVSKCIMGLRDKVALVQTALCILFISQAFCMPKTKKSIKGINKYCNAQNRIKEEKSKIGNNIEALYEKYKFPQTEFTTYFKPNLCYEFDDFHQNTLNEAGNNKNAFQKFKNKNARKIANTARKAHRNFHSKLDSTLEVTPRISSFPNFGNYPNFPEVEYPMTATDIWKPNYWSDFFQPPNIQNNDFKMCQPCKIEKNKYKTSIKNFKVPSKATTNMQPLLNYTKDEICPIAIYTQTTKTPYFNNIIIKDSSSTVQISMDEDASSKTTPIPSYNKSMENDESGEQNYNNLPNTEMSSNDTCESGPTRYICCENSSTIQEKSAQDSSEAKVSNIELDEEFTTDEPEYAFSLSTPLPFSTVDTWKETQVINPYNSLSYADELDDYFIAVES